MSAKLRRNGMVVTLLIVGVGFGLDMLNRGQPQKAAAHGAGAEPGAAPSGPAQVNVQDLLRAMREPAPLNSTEGLRELFAPGERLRTLWTAPAESDADAPQAAASQPTDKPFADRHVLNGVLAGKQAVAIVDGQYTTIGEVIEDYELLEIHRDRVVFGRAEERVELLLRARTGRKP